MNLFKLIELKKKKKIIRFAGSCTYLPKIHKPT